MKWFVERFEAQERRIDERITERFEAQDRRIQERFEAQDRRIDERFEAQNRRFSDQLEAMETKLLTAFHNWAQTYEVRARGTMIAVQHFDVRLGMIEERVATLERGSIPNPPTN